MIFSLTLEKIIKKVKVKIKMRIHLTKMNSMIISNLKLNNAQCKTWMSRKSICLLKWEVNRRKYWWTKESITQMMIMNQTFWFLLQNHLGQKWMDNGRSKSWWWRQVKTFFQIIKCLFTIMCGNLTTALQLKKSTCFRKSYNMCRI